MISLGIYIPLIYNLDIATQELYNLIFSRIGWVIIYLGAYAAFFKIFPSVVYDLEVGQKNAFISSVIYRSWIIFWSIPNIIIDIAEIYYSSLSYFAFLPSILISIGGTAAFLKIFTNILTEKEIDWKRAWKASGRIFLLTLPWMFSSGIIFILQYFWLENLSIFPTILGIFIIFGLIGGIYFTLAGTYSVDFKITAEIITEKNYTWRRSFKAAAKFTGWFLLWTFICALIIILCSIPLMGYDIPPPFFIPDLGLLINLTIFTTLIFLAGGFVLVLGGLAAYIKIFGEIIQ